MAITPAESLATLDFSELLQYARQQLPAYAVPLFLRIKVKMDTTGTFKYQKSRLKEQAFDLERVGDLAVGLQQRVEILKALYRQADILILDEPTGVLTPAEADHLFRILRGLRDQGKTVILITHKLREIMETTDNVSVMRRGTMVGTVKTAETSPEELAELMVGRKVLLEVEKAPATVGRTVLSVENLSVTDEHGVIRLKGVSFEIRAGEILGIAGVAGNGQSELLETIAGIRKAISGGVLLGAFFMANDYVTCPTNRTSQLVYGVGIGVLTVMINLLMASAFASIPGTGT